MMLRHITVRPMVYVPVECKFLMRIKLFKFIQTDIKWYANDYRIGICKCYIASRVSTLDALDYFEYLLNLISNKLAYRVNLSAR